MSLFSKILDGNSTPMAFEESKSISTRSLIASAVYDQHQGYVGMVVDVSRETAEDFSLVVQSANRQSQPNKLRVNRLAIRQVDVDGKRIYVDLRDSRPSHLEVEALPLWQERLVVNRRRRKVGEVSVRKVVDVHTVEVPVRSEKLIVENVDNGEVLAEVGLSTPRIIQSENAGSLSSTAAPDSLTVTGYLPGLQETISALESLKGADRSPNYGLKKLNIHLNVLQGNQSETITQTFQSIETAFQIFSNTAGFLNNRCGEVYLELTADDSEQAEAYRDCLSHYAQSANLPNHSSQKAMPKPHQLSS